MLSESFAGSERQGNREPDFRYGKLPTEEMRTEFRQFLMEREKNISVATMMKERIYYNMICRFLKDGGSRIKSFQDKTL